jgi:hypothetical protein
MSISISSIFFLLTFLMSWSFRPGSRKPESSHTQKAMYLILLDVESNVKWTKGVR